MSANLSHFLKYVGQIVGTFVY